MWKPLYIIIILYNLYQKRQIIYFYLIAAKYRQALVACYPFLLDILKNELLKVKIIKKPLLAIYCIGIIYCTGIIDDIFNK